MTPAAAARCPDFAALLREALSSPDPDLARGVLADWLEERLPGDFDWLRRSRLYPLARGRCGMGCTQLDLVANAGVVGALFPVREFEFTGATPFRYPLPRPVFEHVDGRFASCPNNIWWHVGRAGEPVAGLGYHTPVVHPRVARYLGAVFTDDSHGGLRPDAVAWAYPTARAARTDLSYAGVNLTREMTGRPVLFRKVSPSHVPRAAVPNPRARVSSRASGV